jgi:hypothetical protein
MTRTRERRSPSAFEFQSVADERTVKLDEALPIKAGRVRVVVEVLAAPPRLLYAEFMAWLRQR